MSVLHFDRQHTSTIHLPTCAQIHQTLTYGAMLSIPALVTLALPILAGPMFNAERVAHTLVAACASPALLTTTSSTHTHSMGATIN